MVPADPTPEPALVPKPIQEVKDGMDRASIIKEYNNNLVLTRMGIRNYPDCKVPVSIDNISLKGCVDILNKAFNAFSLIKTYWFSAGEGDDVEYQRLINIEGCYARRAIIPVDEMLRLVKGRPNWKNLANEELRQGIGALDILWAHWDAVRPSDPRNWVHLNEFKANLQIAVDVNK